MKDQQFGGKPPFDGKPPFGGKPPLGGMPPHGPMGGFKPTGGDFMDGPPPQADVSGVRRKFLDVKYASASDAQALDIFLPEDGKGPFPVLVHVHGGAFAIGDKRDGHITKLLEILDMGYALVSINYRLSGEAIFPAAVLDCREAVRFLAKEAKTYTLDADRIGVLGGSAGANLAAMLVMNVGNGEFFGEEEILYPEIQPKIKAGILWFCPTDFARMDAQARENGVSFQDHDETYSPESCYIGVPVQEASKALIDAANPMTYISDAMAPLLMEHGRLDKLVPFQQSVIFAEALDAKGQSAKYRFIPIETADHDDPQFESDENMKIVWEFIKENL